MKSFLLGILLIVVLVAPALSAEEKNKKDVVESATYGQDAPDQQDADKKLFLELLSSNGLDKFSAKYPESRFVDDAQWLVLAGSCLQDIMMGNKTKMEEGIQEIEAFVKKYPDGRLEGETIELLQGEETPVILLLSYSQFINYMRLEMALGIQDNEKAIEVGLMLKDMVDYTVDKSTDGRLANFIYVLVVGMDLELKRFDEAKSLAVEAETKFPQYSWPSKMLAQINTISEK